MNRTQTLGGAAALVLTVLVSGCGSGDTSASDAGSGTASSAPASPADTPSDTPNSSSGASSGSASGGATESAAPAAAAVITIKDFAYEVPSGLQPGDEVMIKNEDDEAHTVTSRDAGAFDVKVDGGSTAMLTVPDKAGSYDFYCIYHSNMEATLAVG